jgi:hypothetical protein
MSNYKKPHFVVFGPPVPIVPISNFSSMALSEQQWADAWSICGPSAERNMQRRFRSGPLELWQVIASAYLEGLQHGHQLAMEKDDDESGAGSTSGDSQNAKGVDQTAGYLC